MPIKVQFDKGTEYKFHQAALRENRSLSEMVRVAAERGIQQSPPVQINGDFQAQAELRNGSKVGGGAYLSDQLSRIVNQLAVEQRRSKSRIVADLLRSGLQSRGLLPAPTADAA